MKEVRTEWLLQVTRARAKGILEGKVRNSWLVHSTVVVAGQRPY